MSPSRREFLRYSAGSAGLLVGGSLAAASDRAESPAAAKAASKAAKPLSILILGGTGFLGPATVNAALARGHRLTLFNRGKTRPQLFPDVEKLHGDRDPKKGDGLKALEGRSWDVAIDNSGYYPRMVRSSAELLAPHVKQYVFISSVSVYKRNDQPGADERTEVGTIADPTVEEMGSDFANYGPLKALCEQAAEKALPGRVANVRPGYIVGPEDPSDRFTYWPVRIARGGEVLVPGTPQDPIQVIDVRDLGEWLVHIAEHRITGVFNALGPARQLTMGEVVDACKAAAGSDAKFTWASSEFLQKLDGEPVYLPIWLPPEGETAGFHRWSNGAAVRAGLKFRPIRETCADTLAWWKTMPAERTSKLRAGLPPEREAEVLAALHKQPAIVGEKS